MNTSPEQARPLPKGSLKLVFLVGMVPDESFVDFKGKVIQQLKAKNILKADGSSNLNSDGSFIVPSKNNQNKQADQTKI